MNPPRNFPAGNLKLVEMNGKELVKVHADLPSSTKNRNLIQNMRLDLLMINPKLDLQIRENNA